MLLYDPIVESDDKLQFKKIVNFYKNNVRNKLKKVGIIL